jgi:hypothetical protein
MSEPTNDNQKRENQHKQFHSFHSYHQSYEESGEEWMEIMMQGGEQKEENWNRYWADPILIQPPSSHHNKWNEREEKWEYRWNVSTANEERRRTAAVGGPDKPLRTNQWREGGRMHFTGNDEKDFLASFILGPDVLLGAVSEDMDTSGGVEGWEERTMNVHSINANDAMWKESMTRRGERNYPIEEREN